MKYLSKSSVVLGIGIIAFTLGCEQNQKAEAQSIETSNNANKINISNAKADVKLDEIKLPSNFKIDVWAADIPNARSMAISEDGMVFVGTRQEGSVYAVIDEDSDGKADARFTLAEDLNMPHGVAYKDGELDAAGVSRCICLTQ